MYKTEPKCTVQNILYQIPNVLYKTGNKVPDPKYHISTGCRSKSKKKKKEKQTPPHSHGKIIKAY